MHATVTGIRASAHLFLIGVDKTQSIALDEIASKKPVYDGQPRDTVTLRMSSKVKKSRSSGTIRLDESPD